MAKDTLYKLIFITAAVFCLTPVISPPIALFMGLILSQTIGHPFIQHNRKATKLLLQGSVIGLGFGMNLFEAAKAGKEGFVFTLSTILATLVAGIIIGKLFAIPKKTTLLIASGTAICGGSAIAAVAPVMEAKEEEISVSLATIFMLNAIALFIFPPVGHYLGLSQAKFGLWSAIAIHDTSSVVGAAAKYGEEALRIATTVKMERALWIIPLSLIMAFIFKSKNSKVNIPWFIFLFVGAMALNTYFPQLHNVSGWIVLIAKKGLTLTLFLIGAGLTRSALKNVGLKPLLLGVILWLFISAASLLVITQV